MTEADIPDDILEVLRRSHAGGWDTRLQRLGYPTEAITPWIWRACGSGSVSPQVTEELQTALLDRLDHLDVAGAMGVLGRLNDQRYNWHPIPRWNYTTERILEAAIARDPGLVLELHTTLDPPRRSQAELALYQEGLLEALSEQTLHTLAHAWLSHPDRASGGAHRTWWDTTVRSCVPEGVWHNACVAVLRQEPIADWEVCIPLMRELTDAELVALLQRSDHDPPSYGRAEATALLEQRGPSILPLLLEAVDDNPNLMLPGLVGLLTAAGQPIPEALDLHLQAELRAWWHGGELTRRMVEQWIASSEQGRQRVGRLVRESLGPHTMAMRLHGLLREPDITEAALDVVRASGRPAGWPLEALAEGFALAGPEGVDALCAAIVPGQVAAAVLVVVRALDAIDTPKATQGLIQALGHRSRTARTAAIEALLRRGEQVLDAPLLEALGSQRKASRQGALRVVEGMAPSPVRDRFISAALDGCPTEPIAQRLQALLRQAMKDNLWSQLKAYEASLDDATRDRVEMAWDTWHQRPTADVTAREGIAVLLVRLPMLQRRYVARQHVSWCHTVQDFSDHPWLPWILARSIGECHPSEQSTYMRLAQRLIKPHALIKALHDVTPTVANRAAIHTLLTALDPVGALDLLLEGLSHRSKPARETALTGVIAAGDVAIPRLMVLLEARRKGDRLMAARALTALGPDNALAPLERALAKERCDDVATALSRAIHACGVQSGLDFERASEEVLALWLADRPPPRLPDGLLDPAQLPSVRWTSGRPLSPQAHQGLLGQLALEAPHHPNRDARRLRPRLNRDDLQRLGEHLLAVWTEADGPSAYSWLREQISITAGPEQVDRWGRNIYRRPLRLTVGWLARHGSLASRSWLAVWSRRISGHASRRIVRQGLDQAATLMGISTEAMLHHHINPHLALELEDQDWTLGYDQDAARQLTVAHHRITLCLLPAHPLNPAALCPELTVGIATLNPSEQPDEPLRLDHLHRVAEHLRTEEALRVQEQAERLHARFNDALQTQRQWTPVGWRRLFVDNPFGHTIAQGALFR
ncbi:MAG: hypothetical protein AAFS10_00755, partial [Myxococcota bacterium]